MRELVEPFGQGLFLCLVWPVLCRLMPNSVWRSLWHYGEEDPENNVETWTEYCTNCYILLLCFAVLGAVFSLLEFGDETSSVPGMWTRLFLSSVMTVSCALLLALRIRSKKPDPTSAAPP
jgi:hypothetical protein